MNRATCRDCGKKITVTRAGVLREHGHPANRCPGGGETPKQTPTPWSEQARRPPPPLEITPRRDLLAEPRTTPVPLRWGEPTPPAITCGGCPDDESAEFARRWPERETPFSMGGPTTLRDLIRAARLAELMPRRDRDAEWGDRRYWRSPDYDGPPYILVAHDPDRGWSVSLGGSNGNNLWLGNPSVEQLVSAAGLCGWPLFDLGSTT